MFWLQAELRPILLRRMKEDVENLPEKEEVVVWVQLTHQQREYYKALYSNQVHLPCCNECMVERSLSWHWMLVSKRCRSD